jgi:hypothetical protein
VRQEEDFLSSANWRFRSIAFRPFKDSSKKSSSLLSPLIFTGSGEEENGAGGQVALDMNIWFHAGSSAQV